MWRLGHPCSHACCVLGLQRGGLDMPVVTPAVFQGCPVVFYALLFAGWPFPHRHHVTAQACLLAGFLCPTAAMWWPVHARSHTCRVLDSPSNGIVTMPIVSLHSPVGAHPTAQGRHTSVGVRLFPCLGRSRDTMCWHRRLCSPAS